MFFIVVLSILLQFFKSFAISECNFNSDLIQKENLTKPEFGTEVRVSFGDVQILKVRDNDCTITMNFHLKLRWNEPRLTYPCNDDHGDNREYFTLPKNAFDWLWVPNIFIIGLKSVKTYALANSINDFYIAIDENNNDVTFVVFETFLEVVFYCPMDFSSFPLDEHDCFFRIQDYNYHEEIVRYLLVEEHFGFNPSEQVSKMDYSIDVIPSNQTTLKQLANRNNNFAVVGFEIKLRRNLEKYLVNYYIPSALLVGMSWVSLVHPSLDLTNKPCHTTFVH